MSARCEDYPCCGHELGDCDGSLYGSDESIKARVYEDIRNGHGDCDHQDGIYNCEGGDEDECDDEEHECNDCDSKTDGWECHWCGRPCPENAHRD